MGGRFALAASVAVVVVCLAACSVSIDFAGTEYQCPDGVTCPDGFVCVDNVCRDDVPGSDAGASDGGTDAGPNPMITCGDPALINSDFEDGLPWWSYTDTEDGGMVSVVNGAVRVEAAPTAGDQTAVGDKFHTTFRDGRLFLSVANVASTEPYFGFYENNRVEVRIEGTDLVGEITYGGQSTSGSASYDPVAHRFWSISEEAGLMKVEVSPDGVTWTVLHQRTAEFDLEFGHIEFGVRSTGVAGSADFDDLGGGAPPVLVACGLGGVVEEFDDSQLDPLYMQFSGDCAAAITGGQLQWTQSNQGGAEPFCALDTAYRVDLREGSIGYEAVTLPGDTPDQYFYFQVRGEDGEFAFYVDDGTLAVDLCNVSGCVDLGTAALDPVAHRFWRIRHTDPTIYAETSPDGSNWTQLASLNDFDAASLQVELRFGSGSAANEVMVVDNFGPKP